MGVETRLKSRGCRDELEPGRSVIARTIFVVMKRQGCAAHGSRLRRENLLLAN
jgi:hypothetical protein